MAAFRAYHCAVDLEGRLWHAGTEIVDPGILNLYLENLEQDEDGRFLFRCAGEVNYVRALDTPYVIHDIDFERQRLRGGAARAFGGPRDGLASVTARFIGGYAEPLDPATLEVGAAHVLYAWVRDGRFRARFSRNAYYRLAEWIEETEDGFVLTVGETRHRIRLGDDAEQTL